MNSSKMAIRGTTQEHLDIEDIQDGIVILKDGSCCLVIATTSINFNLLSAKEQDATIYAYAGLLNSLTFSIQIVIRSQRKDISSYLNLLDEAEQKESRKLIKEQIQKYRLFVREVVQKNEVLDKKAYIAIPMSALELGITKTLSTTFKSHKKLPFEKSYILEKGKVNLYPKRDHILRLLARLGLKGHQLNTQELIQLFFNTYNPGATGQQFVSTEQYQMPLVQAALAPPPSEQEVEPEAENPEAENLKTAQANPQATNLPKAPSLIQPPSPPSAANDQVKTESEPTTIQDEINNLVRHTTPADMTVKPTLPTLPVSPQGKPTGLPISPQDTLGMTDNLVSEDMNK